MALTRINNQALTNVTSAGLPSGTVLQVKQEAFTGSHITTSSTSYVASSITDTITPTSASSKVMITLSGGHCSYHSGGASIIYKVVRTIGATSTDVSSATHWMEKNNAGNSFGEPISGNYLDSPSTTNAVTYTVHIKSNNGSLVYLTNTDSLLTITLMEIAG